MSHAGASASGGAPAQNGGAPSVTAGASASVAGAGTSGAAGALIESGGGGGGGPGGTQAGAGGGTPTCNGATLCDSFERADLGPDWTRDNKTTSGTTIEVVTNKGHTGSNSVHISFGTTTLQTFVSVTKGITPSTTAYWGRAWIFAQVPLAGHQIFVEARVADGGDKSGVRSFNTFDKIGGLGLNLESTDASKNTSTTMIMGSWVCYEWQITGIGGGPGAFSSWVDGTPMATMSTPLGTLSVDGTGKKVIPKVTRQRIGIQRYEAGAAGELWIDDVAIGDQRITCAP